MVIGQNWWSLIYPTYTEDTQYGEEIELRFGILDFINSIFQVNI